MEAPTSYGTVTTVNTPSTIEGSDQVAVQDRTWIGRHSIMVRKKKRNGNGKHTDTMGEQQQVQQVQPSLLFQSFEMDEEEDDRMEGQDVSESSSPPSTSSRPRLKVVPLAMIIFYGVAGGPFGMEETVRNAGAYYSILGFLIGPLIWSLPESLLTAELSSTYPEASGSVAWVEEAFGPAAGFMSGYLSWVSGATDSKFCVWTTQSSQA